MAVFLTSAAKLTSHLIDTSSLYFVICWISGCLVKYVDWCSSELHPFALETEITDLRLIIFSTREVILEE